MAQGVPRVGQLVRLPANGSLLAWVNGSALGPAQSLRLVPFIASPDLTCRAVVALRAEVEGVRVPVSAAQLLQQQPPRRYAPVDELCAGQTQPATLRLLELNVSLLATATLAAHRCALGHAGPACMLCADGFAIDGAHGEGGCVSCAEATRPGPLMTALAVLGAGTLVWSLRRCASGGGEQDDARLRGDDDVGLGPKLKIVVGLLQVLSQLPYTLSLAYPPAFDAFLQASRLSFFDVFDLGLPLECAPGPQNSGFPTRKVSFPSKWGARIPCPAVVSLESDAFCCFFSDLPHN